MNWFSKLILRSRIRVMALAIVCALTMGLSATGLFAAGPETDKAGIEFFEKKIRPVLVKHCYECHSAASNEIKGELSVDSRDSIRSGGESGAAVVPHAIDESLLIDALRYESFEMPPKGKLPDAVIDDFVKWIEMGAPDPRDKALSSEEAAELSWRAIFNERKKWWSLQPLSLSPPPSLKNNNWSDQPVDRFILAKLQQAKLQPAAEADRQTLLRRLSFVLTGLPPSPEHVKTFADNSAKDKDAALAVLVDELLGSPHFGERIARHWMDVVRYTDTYGYEWDNPAKGSWEYRDYLVRAFNKDIGFDQLVREQIAGDLLAQPRIDHQSGFNESLIGPMFYHLGEHRHGDSLDFNGIHQEMVNNKIDAFSKAFLAHTLACARCHDHKLDALPQRDYYALAGVFMTPRWTSRVIDAPGKNDAAIEELKSLRRQIDQALKLVWSQQADSFANELAQAMTFQDKEGHSQAKRLALWRAAFGVKTDKSNKSASKISIEDITFLPSRLLATSNDAEVETLWKELAAQWKSTSEPRKAQNRQQFQLLANFAEPNLPPGWVTEGDGMKHGYVSNAEPLVSLKGDLLVQQILPRGYHTHALSSKLPGSLRLPRQQDIPKKSVSVKLAGGQWSGFLRIPDNAFQTEGVMFLKREQPLWQTFTDGALRNGVQRIRIEIATSDLNPNFPPRTGKATAGGEKLPEQDTGFHKRSWFSATGIVAHDGGGTPVDELDRFASLYAASAPTTTADAWRRIGDWLATSVSDWAAGNADAEDVQLIHWLLSQKLLNNKMEPNSPLAALVNQYRTVEENLPYAHTINSMDEREVVAINYPLNIRGNVHELGPQIPRDFLQVFSGQNKVNNSPGSGRLELAQSLVAPKHPLTARVYVNRVWQWVFGTGIVRTSNDFGHLGSLPIHPELLDYLSREFVADGWSTKRLIRRLVLSQTFRQSGVTKEQAVVLDPGNRLLHHYPTRRLEAEAIRDSLLAVSGQLDRQLSGPPIDPPRTKEDPAKRLFSGPLDGNRRRSIYIKMSIMDPPKFLVGFNLPDLKLPTGRRDVTNVPTQALILLNDPFVVGQARLWAERLVKDQHKSVENRLQAMFVESLGRAPTEKELLRWAVLVRDFGDNKKDELLMANQDAWMHVAHTLFNTKEFIYYR